MSGNGDANMQPGRAIRKIGAAIVSMATAGVAFSVPWLVLSPNPTFLGYISYRTATSAALCALVAILSWAALSRKAGPSPEPEEPAHARAAAPRQGRYFHGECGARFDEPAVFEDFVGKKKYYACPACTKLLGEVADIPPPPLPKVDPPAAPEQKPQEQKPQEGRVLLEVVIKGPAEAKLVQAGSAP